MKRRNLILFILYCFICILITVNNSMQYKEKIKIEKYGLSSDKTIDLETSDVIECEFMLNHDNFQGLSVKFQADDLFTTEVLVAELYDSSSNDLLVQDQIQLCNERIQNKDSGATIFLALPLEESINRKVRLKLYLDADAPCVIPLFVISKTKVLDSVLTKNESVLKGNLVFETRYISGYIRNGFNSILNGILWLVIGGLLFFWVSVSNVQYNNKFSILIEGIIGKTTNMVVKRKKVIGICLICIVYIIGFVYVYEYYVQDAMKQISKEKVVDTVDNQLIFNFDRNAECIHQVFVSSKNNLSGVSIPYMSDNVSSDSKVELRIVDSQTGVVLVDEIKEILNSHFNEDIMNLDFQFRETIRESEGKEMIIELIPVNFEETELQLFLGEQKNNIDNKSDQHSFIFSAIYGNVQFLKYIYCFIGGFMFFCLIVFYYVCFVKNVKIQNMFIVFALLLGISYNFMIALNTVPDEPSHIDTAYSISNKIMGIEECSKPGYIYKRVEDIDQLVEDKQTLDVYSYEYLYNNIFTLAEDNTLVECAVRNNLGNASEIYYLPQAIGITVGRLLNLGHMPTMLLARMFSLIVYISIMFVALTKMPIGKNSLFLIGILPITLQQAASISYDSLIISLSALYICYTLSLIYSNDELKAKDLAVILITGSMLATVKGGVYVPICLLPLLAFYVKKKLSNKEIVCIGSIVAISIFAFLKRNLARTIARFLTEQGTVTGGAASTEIYTFGYLLEYPHRFIGMFVNTFYKQGDAYLRNLLGGNLAWRDINISWFIVIGFLVILLVSCLTYSKERKFTIFEKVFFLFISFATYFVLELSMLLVWTPTTLTYITGVQGRYFIPFFILVLFLFRSNIITLKKNINKYLFFGAGMLNIYTLFQVIQRITALR